MVKNIYTLSLLSSLLFNACSNSNEVKQSNNIIDSSSVSQNNTSNENQLGEDSLTEDLSHKVDVEQINNLSQVCAHLAKSPSKFNINSSRDTVIRCKEGTLLSIPANAFLNAATQTSVTGNVKIVVNEYYKISDMIIAGLTTTSNDRLIETGGMLKITATSNGDTCVLKPSKTITIGMPKTDSDTFEGMQLFNGTHSSDMVNWLPNNSMQGLAQPWKRANDGLFEDRIYFNSEFVFPDELPKKAPALLSNKPEDLITEMSVPLRDLVGQNGQVTKKAIGYIDTLGNLHTYKVDYRIQKLKFQKLFSPTTYNNMKVNLAVDFSINYFSKLNQDYYQKLFKMGKGNPDSLVMVSARLIPKVKVVSSERVKKMNSSFMTVKQFQVLKKRQIKMQEEFERKVKQLKLLNEERLTKQEKSGKTSLQLAQNYLLLSTPNLGWINCDRFFSVPDKVNYFVDLKDKANLLIVFNAIKAIVAPDQKGFVYGVPKGESITLVGLKTENGKLMMALHETIISEKPFDRLVFKPVTIKEYKNKLEELNRI